MNTKNYRVLRLAAAAILLAGTVLNSIPVRVVHADSNTLTVTTTDDNTSENTCVPAPNPGDLCSLRAAINLANGDLGNLSNIVFAIPDSDLHKDSDGVSTITLNHIGAGEENNATGDLDIDKNSGSITISGKSITIYDPISGDPVGTTNDIIIDGNRTDRVLDVHLGTVKLYNLTLQHGQTQTCSSGSCFENGGGIYNLGNLFLYNTVITLNQAGSGTSTAPYPGSGGGIYNKGYLYLNSQSVISSNTAGNAYNTSPSIKGGDGGGIFNAGTLRVTDSTFDSNATGSGGGNQSDGYGGAIYNYSQIPTLDHVTFQDNHTGPETPTANPHPGGYGGAIYNLGNGATIDTISGTSQFTGNHASSGVASYSGGNGGAILNANGGTITNIESTDFSNNYAGDGGNSAGDGGVGGAIFNGGAINTLTGLTFTDNAAGNGGAGSGVGGNGGAIFNAYSGKLGDNGSIAGLTFTTNHAGSGGNYSATYNGSNGGKGGNGGAIYNDGNLTNPFTDMLFTGNTAGDGGIGGGGGAIYNSGRIVHLGDSTETSPTLITFTNNSSGNGGSTALGTGVGGNGGAIFNSGAIEKIYRVVIDSNTTGSGGLGATDRPYADAGMGAGIYTTGAVTLLDSSLITNNKTGQTTMGPDEFIKGGNGGGIAIYNGQAAIGLVNTTIAENQASAGGYGAGIYFFNASSLTVVQSTIYHNQNKMDKDGIYGHGAGIYKDYGDDISKPYVSVSRSILAENTQQTPSATIHSDCFEFAPSSSYTLHSGRYNILSAKPTDEGALSANTCASSFSTTNNDIFGDPGLSASADFAMAGLGVSVTMAGYSPSTNSPAIDKIPRILDSNYPYTERIVDQRGYMRRGLLDIGAIEAVETNDPSADHDQINRVFLPLLRK